MLIEELSWDSTGTVRQYCTPYNVPHSIRIPDATTVLPVVYIECNVYYKYLIVKYWYRSVLYWSTEYYYCTTDIITVQYSLFIQVLFIQYCNLSTSRTNNTRSILDIKNIFNQSSKYETNFFRILQVWLMLLTLKV